MASTNHTAGDKKPTFVRLPTNVQPTSYSITLKPDLDGFTFTGHETIKVKVIENTSTIVINSVEINVDSVVFRSHTGDELKASDWKTDDESQLLTIDFGNQLPAGDGELFISFTGLLNDKMKGFYRAKSVVDGKDIYMAVTQFEPTDARRAFPCWDEPAIKAAFDITLIVPKDKTALSNMNVIKEEPYTEDPEWKVIQYATTPVMSTYLVAVAVGDYDYIEAKSGDGVLCRVYTQKTKQEQGRLSLDVCVKALPFYKEYFGIPYPLSKMDFLSVPDFSAGAMENWGLITYREACLLYDPEHTSSQRKQLIPVYVAHELGHQWFGNLVTMEWWTNLWLNEGFATFMECLCVDHIFPEYRIWEQFVTDKLNCALNLDGLHSSHPVEVPVGDPAEIDEIFDDISYSKGASVIRMLYEFIGEESFKKGLHNYLVKFSYKNTVTEDLWAAYEASSNKPVMKVMDSWIKQKGYPVITVESKQNGNDRVLKLTQEKFCSSGQPCDGDKDLIWLTPISFIKQSDPKQECAQILLDKRSDEIVINDVKPDEWIKLNPRAVGVYRVLYSPEMLSQFYEPIETKQMPALDRFNVQSDLFALVQAGRASTIEILKLMKSFINEDNYTVWCSVNSSFGKLNSILAHTDFHQDFKAYGRKLFQPIFNKLGFDAKDNENHLDKLLRTLIINRLAIIDDVEVAAEAKKRFDDHYTGKAFIPADIRSAMYRAIIADCDDEMFEKFFEMYRKADSHDEKNRILASFSTVKDLERIKRVLEFILSGEVRDQDIVGGIAAVSATRVGVERCWEFYKQNFELLKTRCLSGFLSSNLVKCCTSSFTTEERAREVEQFFNEHKYPSVERAVSQSIESIRLNAAWLDRDAQSIKDYLKNEK